MNRMPWFMFYPSDWIKGTRPLSLEEKGVWIDLLCYMWESGKRGEISGTYEDFARMVGSNWNDIAITINSMKQKNCFNVTECNGIVTLTCRRMLREHLSRESSTFRVREYRKRKCNANVTRNTHTQKSEVIKDKDIAHVFVKPTCEEVAGYFKELGSLKDPLQFFDHYEANGWKVGKVPMKNWKATVRNWNRNGFTNNGKQGDKTHDWAR
jgi:uncharacterized protein YdaU (DUF1376 family)